MAVVVVLGFLLVCFAAVVFVGPPYLPTLAPQVKTALDLLDLKPGDTMVELGCGDGKVLVAAAQRGWNVTGIELNPVLVAVCWLRTLRYRKQVKVVWGNYWNIGKWPPAEGIFGFVLPKYMSKLDACIAGWLARTVVPARTGARLQSKSATETDTVTEVRLASFAFKIPGKAVAREERGVFLYLYDCKIGSAGLP